MGFSSLNQEGKHVIMDDDVDVDVDEGLDTFSSNSSSDVSSVVSSESDSLEDEEVTSFATSPVSGHRDSSGAMNDMSSILQQLPTKRGLSKHFQGKSQSFTSLSNVLCVEDLAKPENPYNKKLKSCKSYGGLLLLAENNSSSSRLMNSKKKASKGSCSSLMNAKKNNMSFLGNRPPIHHHHSPPHRSTSTNNFSNQTPLFA